jgi:hypothetical protein
MVTETPAGEGGASREHQTCASGGGGSGRNGEGGREKLVDVSKHAVSRPTLCTRRAGCSAT